MKATQALHDLGQSLWIDDITRNMLDSGTLKKYIEEFSVTGLTSNPTIFDKAISKSTFYDEAIRKLMKSGWSRASSWRQKSGRSCHSGGSLPNDQQRSENARRKRDEE